MSSFVIKIIAIVTMLIDHVGYNLYNGVSWMHIVGRMSFPLFAFQLTLGYKNTKCFWKYALRLLVFALISQYPYYLFHESLHQTDFSLNVFFTLFFGLLSMFIYDYKPILSDKLFNIFTWICKSLLITCLCLIAKTLNCDYDIFGILLILAIHIFYEYKNKIPFVVSYLVLIAIFYKKYFVAFSYPIAFAICLFTFLPIIIMLLYNGKKGYNMKYWFYLFYPIHLLLIVWVKYFLFMVAFNYFYMVV